MGAGITDASWSLESEKTPRGKRPWNPTLQKKKGGVPGSLGQEECALVSLADATGVPLDIAAGRWAEGRTQIMDTAKKLEYRKLLLSLVPDSGENIGNVSLREELQQRARASADELTDEDYWSLRDALIDEGVLEQGRGRGGSVHRVRMLEAAPISVAGAAAGEKMSAVAVAVPAEVLAEVVELKSEADLYEPFHHAIVDGYTKDNRIKRFISEVTAQQGRRITGGKWTRPDITLIAVRAYTFTPGKRVEVITFEVKPDIDGALEGVYEALAHSAFAHRSYLAVDIREFKGREDEIPHERIVHECTRHGVGYIAFTDVSDYATYDVVCSAKLNEPDPYDVDNFVKTQISQAKQEEIREFLQY